MYGLFPGTRLPTLNFIACAILKILAFNAQTFIGSSDSDHAHLLVIFVRGQVWTIISIYLGLVSDSKSNVSHQY